jgi:hypothetical protein
MISIMSPLQTLTASSSKLVARLTFCKTIARRHVVVARTPEAGKRVWTTRCSCQWYPDPNSVSQFLLT